jgi:hypothetical protein
MPPMALRLCWQLCQNSLRFFIDLLIPELKACKLIFEHYVDQQ